MKLDNPDDYEEASSDPYIVFSIDPPTNPGCKVRRLDRRKLPPLALLLFLSSPSPSL